MSEFGVNRRAFIGSSLTASLLGVARPTSRAQAALGDDGARYQLYWGDLHRHTDVSNCRTGFDGCINEHFRYAYDASGLDYLTTTDHSDQGKGYTDYEWWQTQNSTHLVENKAWI